MCYTQEKLPSGNPLRRRGVAVLEMEVEVGNKVSDRQRIISMSAQSCNQMQIGLFSSPNELSIDVRLDLQAGRATVHAAGTNP